jgi:bifunctional UDP-N-acetylglucosamine pyrophosphorylase/glucosamine-1-phosphate N-acetyltransferase/UDP-N-acetylglucosamine pyrophosphorylase
MKPIKAIILAAGKGTRMKSDLPKVLMLACGRPLVDYVLDTVRAAGIDDIVVVVGYQAELVREALHDRKGVRFCEQTEQLGTGHAVQICRGELEGFDGGVLVLTGDSPLTQVASLAHLIDLFQSEQTSCVMGTLLTDDPAGLGRIVRDGHGNFLAIVEEKDATEDQKKINEVNMSTYLFDCRALLGALDRLSNNNRQGEFYITDCPGILKSDGLDVRALPVLRPCEALSINTVEDLRIVEEEMRRIECES